MRTTKLVNYPSAKDIEDMIAKSNGINTAETHLVVLDLEAQEAVYPMSTALGTGTDGTTYLILIKGSKPVPHAEELVRDFAMHQIQHALNRNATPDPIALILQLLNGKDSSTPSPEMREVIADDLGISLEDMCSACESEDCKGRTAPYAGE